MKAEFSKKNLGLPKLQLKTKVFECVWPPHEGTFNTCHESGVTPMTLKRDWDILADMHVCVQAMYILERPMGKGQEDQVTKALSYGVGHGPNIPLNFQGELSVDRWTNFHMQVAMYQVNSYIMTGGVRDLISCVAR